MAFTRFSSFLLMSILLLHVGNSSTAVVLAHQAKKVTVVAEGGELPVAESTRSLEISDGVRVPAAMDEVISNTRLGGRKMMPMKRVLTKKMKEEPLNKEDSEISGKSTFASKNPRSRFLHANSENPRSQQAPAKGTCFQYLKPVSATTGNSLECSSKSINPIPQELDGSSQNLEFQKLLDKAAMEIVNLMNKDYTGGGGPRHKPPVNNEQPMSMSDQQHDLIP